MKGVNWLGLVLALIASQAIGFVWYGLVFETRWLALSGVDPATANATASMIWGTVDALVVVVGLALAIPALGKTTLMGGATVGLAAAVFFAIPTLAFDVVYGAEPIELLAIEAGYLLVYYMVAGALIGGVTLRRTVTA